MKKLQNRRMFNLCFIILITLLLTVTLGCWGESDSSYDNDNSNIGDATDTNGPFDDADRLICEEMLSEDFLASHSLSIETDMRFENPIVDYNEITTNCAVREAGNWVAAVTALNSNSATYDGLLAKFQLEHDMVIDNSVGMKSAYTIHDTSLNLLTYMFLASNNATTVTILQVLPMGLEETRALAQEIDMNLPDVTSIENTAPDYQCPDMISESDLSAIFGNDLTYRSPTPDNTANTLSCRFEAPESDELSEILDGTITLYCNPAAGQTSPQDMFQSREDAIVSGSEDVFGNTMIYHDVEFLDGIGAKAYYYTMTLDIGSTAEIEDGFKFPVLMVLHSSKNCYIELNAYDASKDDIREEMIEVVEKLISNL